MVTLGDCQRLQSAWFVALAAATGGKTFDTHQSHWVWLPARRELMLMFPEEISPAGIRPGLAEGVRLGAATVGIWMNSTVTTSMLPGFGFEHGWQPWWMTAHLDSVLLDEPVGIGLEPDSPEITGPDSAELQVVRRSAPASAGPAAKGSRAWHAVARAEGRLVGHGYSFLPDGGGNLRIPALAGIFNMAVGTDYRRRGYGSGILSRVARSAGAAGAEHLALNATPLGERLYSRRGFQLIGRGQTYWLHLAK